jgi:pimeloyl-ACP methyl ester carboxylesterase
MDIFGGIDGTGPYSDSEYAAAFANSNVSKLARMAGWAGGSFYDRGPGADGLSTGARADEMAAKVVHAYQAATRLRPGAVAGPPGANRQPRIFLAGYSRGGAAATNIAHTLNDQNIPVHCLLLFDAVDRSATIWRTIVPANVRHCYHAIRSPRSGSRTSFGNCSTTAQAGLRIVPMEFMCTHGAMGGMPWPAAETDGFIHERDVTTAADGILSWGTLGKVASAIGTTALTGSLAAGAAAAHMYDGASRTNITLAQESAGNVGVWNWMVGNLNTAKAAYTPA